MSTRLSLRGRLNLMIALAMVSIVGIGFLFALHDARQSVRNEAQSTVSLALQLVEAGLQTGKDNGNSVARWMSHLGRLDRIRHLRIRAVGPYSSTLNSITPASIARETVPNWFRFFVEPEPIRVERKLQDVNGQHYTIIIEGNADDEIIEAWSETSGFLGLLMVLAGAVYVLVHFIVGQSFRSVDTILEGLEHIEKGVFDKRLPELSLPEFNRITSAFNHMACKLEKTRKENRELVHKSIRIQEEERRHLARELHDELGQSLTAIKVMAAALRPKKSSPTDGPADQIIGICDQLFLVIRSMMRRLRPSVLDELGLVASLEDLVENWRMGHPELSVALRCSKGIDEACADASIDLFRIAQECLTNVVKHAEAQRVAIDLNVEEGGQGNCVVLLMRDDGKGFDPEQIQGGFGLHGIRERVDGLNGTLSITSQPGQGVTIEIRIPSGGLHHE